MTLMGSIMHGYHYSININQKRNEDRIYHEDRKNPKLFKTNKFREGEENRYH